MAACSSWAATVSDNLLRSTQVSWGRWPAGRLQPAAGGRTGQRAIQRGRRPGGQGGGHEHDGTAHGGSGASVGAAQQQPWWRQRQR